MGRRNKIVEIKPFTWVDTTPIDDPACVRDDSDPRSAFAQYLLPKLKDARDEASREVLEYLKVEDLTDAIAHTIQSLPANKTKKLRDWVREAQSTRIYAYCYVDTRGTGTAAVGLMLTAGKATDKILATEEGYDIGIDLSYRHFEEVLEEMEEVVNSLPTMSSAARKSALEKIFEEENRGMVLVSNERQYGYALQAMGISASAWNGAGIYDFYQQPPKFLGSLAAWRHAVALSTAEDMLAEQEFKPGQLKNMCTQLRSERR